MFADVSRRRAVHAEYPAASGVRRHASAPFFARPADPAGPARAAGSTVGPLAGSLSGPLFWPWSRLLSRRGLRPVLSTALLPLLFAGCTAIAPGMHFDQAQVPSVPAQAKDPIIRAITPQLVAQERRERQQQSMADLGALMSSGRPYTIDSGDVLSITVWDHPELTNAQAAALTADAMPAAATPAGFVVDHRGNVQFPYAGMLKLAGLTEDQARQALSRKLAYYITRPDVTLRVQSYRSKRVYVDGEVRTPGMVAINDLPMTLVEALNRAGGAQPSADQSRIVIIRDGTSYPVNLMQLVQHGINPASIMLANGDVVRVLSREENKVFVSGEVMTPRALPMHDGRMTLNEALGEAGGINPNSGDGRQVYVIRNGGDAQPLVYHLNSRAPTELALAEEFELKPKDVVYVDATSLTTWSRVVNLILPSAFSGAVSSAATFRAIR